jgi:hypothetical protein
MSPRRIDSLTGHAAKIATLLADSAFVAWQTAQLESDIALDAWRAAGRGRSATAHLVYRAAVDREEAAARHFEQLCHIGNATTAARA